LNVAPAGKASIELVPLFERLEPSVSHVGLVGGERTTVPVTGDVFTASAPDMTIPVMSPVQVAWQTSNAAVALVDAATGEIEAWAPGDAAVTIASGGATADITVNVTATIQSLRALTIRAYDEKAIKERGIRTALLAKLDAAAAGVPGALTDYIDQLKALRGKQILTVWADRLIANAVWVAAR
jgi:hypothetical protein